MSKRPIYLMISCLLCLLSGCGKPLSNEEIIKQTKICRDAGLRASSWHENIIHENSITRVECQP